MKYAHFDINNRALCVSVNFRRPAKILHADCFLKAAEPRVLKQDYVCLRNVCRCEYVQISMNYCILL
jgi:hypothetical protein